MGVGTTLLPLRKPSREASSGDVSPAPASVSPVGDAVGRIRMAEDAGALSGVDTAMLEPMVRDLLGEPAAVVAEEWSCLPLGGGAATVSASTGSPGRRVSAVPPIPGRSSSRCLRAADGADPGAWDYPAREGLAYGSGLLDGAARWACCPALPRCRDAARRDELALARGDHRRAPRSVAARALRLGRPRAWPLQRRLPGRSAPA